VCYTAVKSPPLWSASTFARIASFPGQLNYNAFDYKCRKNKMQLFYQIRKNSFISRVKRSPRFMQNACLTNL